MPNLLGDGDHGIHGGAGGSKPDRLPGVVPDAAMQVVSHAEA